MDNPVYRVQPWAGGWGVFRDEKNEAREPYRTAADAVIHAKELARSLGGGAQIIVYGEHGAIVSDFFFQHEERAALEADDQVASTAASRPATRRARPEPRRGA